MNDETRDDSDASEVEDKGPLGGERLRAAREEQQIAILEIAKELHLDEPKVKALERNEFDSLGAPVFAKGHLRKYAELVGVDERDILADYHELTRSAGMPPVVGKRRRTGSELSPGPWIALILLLIAVAFAYWWFTAGRDMSTSTVAPEEAAPADSAEIAAPADSPAEPADVVVDTPADAGPDTLDETAVPADEPPLAVPVPEEASDAPVEPVVPAEGGAVLTLSFAEDCWTEVTDSSGARLFFELGRAGTSVTVEGTAPLSVLLGSADGVSVEINGEPYAIRAADRRGRTARLTLP